MSSFLNLFGILPEWRDICQGKLHQFQAEPKSYSRCLFIDASIFGQLNVLDEYEIFQFFQTVAGSLYSFFPHEYHMISPWNQVKMHTLPSHRKSQLHLKMIVQLFIGVLPRCAHAHTRCSWSKGKRVALTSHLFPDPGRSLCLVAARRTMAGNRERSEGVPVGRMMLKTRVATRLI